MISIHTPTKGATKEGMSGSLLIGNFNPHSHEGSDSKLHYILGRIYAHFNPHSHEGSDGEHGLTIGELIEFQSTLPRRERRYTLEDIKDSIPFQSTLPRRERRYECVPCYNSVDISIHTPTKGATELKEAFIRRL